MKETPISKLCGPARIQPEDASSVQAVDASTAVPDGGK
jgi:hypothetical protein